MRTMNIAHKTLVKAQAIKLGKASVMTLGKFGHYSESMDRPMTGLWGKREFYLKLGKASKVTLGGAGYFSEGVPQRPGWQK